MSKNKSLYWIIALAIGFVTSMILLCFSAVGQATAVSQSVLRFHIVAASDSQQDQELKMLVRDGIAEFTDQLFAKAKNKEQAIAIARDNADVIAQNAQEILANEGCDDKVQVRIKELWFPTKSYQNITFPAGKYDAIHITIGEGEGENFWCVMFPALCVNSVSESNEQLLSGVLGEDEMKLVTRPYTLKFKAAEWLGKLAKFF